MKTMNTKRFVLSLLILQVIFNLQISVEAQEGATTDSILAVSDRTPAVRDAIVASVEGVTDAANVTETHLAGITGLNLRNKSITTLKSGDFSGLSGLTSLNLYNNQLSTLPDGIFKGLTALTSLRLGGNTTDPMQVNIYLENTEGNNYKLVVPTGAPFDIAVSIVLSDGVIREGIGNQTVSKGSVESTSFTAPSINNTTIEISDALPSLPRNHFGYELVRIEPPSENNAPVFTDGETASRSIAENTAAATNIGTPIVATDADTDDTLTYSLSGTDAASFSIVSTSGQLQTEAVLDYETKTSYTVTVTVSDGNEGSDTITVTINVTDVDEVTDATPVDDVADAGELTDLQTPGETLDNNAPIFTDGTITTRSIAENTAPETNIGLPVVATDTDEDDTLTYTLGGRDVTSFAIDGETGQLKTRASLDYETRSVYLVSVTVSDTKDTDTISVVISIIDVSDTTILTTTIGVGDRTPQVRDAIVAAVPNVSDAASVTDAHLGAITSLSIRNAGITELRPGDFSGLTGMTSLNLYGNMLRSLPDGIFNGLTSLTSLRLGGNVVEPIPLIVSLEQVSEDQYKVVIPTGAPFDVSVPLNITDGINPERLGSVVVSKGSIRSAAASVPVVNGAYIDIGELPNLPVNHFGYILTRSATCNVTQEVAEAIAAAVPGVDNCQNVSAAQLASITSLDLSNKSISSLQSNDFSSLLSLSMLNLQDNQLSSLPDGIFSGLTSLTSVQLSGNSGAPFSFEVSLEKVGTDQFKVVLPLGAPFNINVPITVANGNTITNVPLTRGSIESDIFTVTRTQGTIGTVTVTIGTLPSIPSTHNGYELSRSSDLPLTIFEAINVAPVFTEGATATRSVAENTAAGTNIGSPIVATDVNSTDTLTYTLSGTDAASFEIVSSTGQLQTRAALDYETKTTYTLTVTVTDDNLSDTISVTVNVTDVAENIAPVFTEGATATRSIAENTEAGTDIGSPISATDANSTDTLTYTLSGTHASTFDIVSTTGQLQTKNHLNFEQRSSYSVTVNVSDGEGGSDSIDVTINVTDVVDEGTQQARESENEQETPIITNNPPSFTEGTRTTRSIAENTDSGTNIGTPVAATDADTTDSLTYSITGRDASSFTIVGTTGQLRTSAALDFETKNAYTLNVNVSDGNGGSDSITVRINVTDVTNEDPQQTPEIVNNLPSFTDGTSTTRSIAENTESGTNIGSPVGATDVDTSAEIPDVLSYTLSGTDASSFSIDSTSGQLQTKASLDFETKTSYSVTVGVSDGRGGTDSISVTINVIDVNEIGGANVAPVFSDGESTYRLLDSQPSAGTFVGAPIVATDANEDTLTYTLSGSHANRFNINSSTGQLRVKTGGIGFSYYNDAFRKSTVTVSVSDGNGGTDSITVDVHLMSSHGDHAYNNVTPFFGDAVAGEYIFDPLFIFTEIIDNVREYEIAENSEIGSLVAAIHVADENVGHQNWMRSTISGPDADSFRVHDQSKVDFSLIFIGGPLASYSITEVYTNIDLDFETKENYSIIVTVTDLEGASDTLSLNIKVTDVNEAPIFSDGTSTTRSIAENSPTGISIGSAISASDPEDDNMTYTLGGTDALSFSISSTTGQLTTSAPLDYETKSSYSVTVTASDGTNTTSIDVTINVTDLNEVVTQNPPVFSEGRSTTRSISENTISGTNIGSAVTATDADAGTTLSYSLSGTDAGTFSIDSSSGQLQTSGPLDYETKDTYSVTVNVTDGNLTDTISVTINVTDANDAPTFDEGSSTIRNIGEKEAIGSNVGEPVRATDQDREQLTYSLSGTDGASFTINESTGQISSAITFSFETKRTYSVVVTVEDNDSFTDSITVTINIEKFFPGSQIPVFDALSVDLFATITRSVDENSASGTNIGSPVSSTDPDEDDTLTYSLPDGNLDNESFSIVSSTGQLQTSASLNHETKASYRVFIRVTDGSNSATTTVRINVNDINDAPVFTDGSSITLSVAENTAADTNIGSAIAATDEDEPGDTLTYTISGTDASSFAVVGTSGQIQTKADLDYETKASYTLTLTVSDGNNGSDTIAVTINVTDLTEVANQPPEFSDGATVTRSIPENTTVGSNVGAAITATDPDTGDTVTYSLSGTDASSFSVGSSTGQLTTAVTFDYENKASYTVVITALDGKPNNGKDTITVTINITDVTENNAPVFTAGDSTTRSINEVRYDVDPFTLDWVNVGSPITATDADNDTLTYAINNSLSFFRILNSGQLQSLALDYENSASHTLTIKVTDTNGGSDTISVTVTVNDVDEKPVLDSDTETIDVNGGIAAGSNIGSVYTAYDYDDEDTLTFSLSGTDASSFTITSSTTVDYTGSDGYSRSATGQITNNSVLNSGSYSLTVVVTDSDNLTAETSITINAIPPPDPAVSSRTQAVQEAIVTSIDGVNSVGEVTGLHLASITSLDLSNKSISSMSSGDFKGMSSLTSINLSGNQLTGNLPDGLFEGLTGLTTLNLSGNSGTPKIVLSIETIFRFDNTNQRTRARVKANTGAPLT